MAEAIGFFGLGKMGLPIATRLLDAGHALVVHDTRSEAAGSLVARGARLAASPAEVADAAATVLLSLPTPDVVQNVALGPEGIVAGGRAKLVVDLSTTGPRVTADIAEEMEKAGRTWIDSPVSGGVRGAVAGTLAVMVSGPRESFDRLVPLLQVVGKPFYIGARPGMAQTMKLVNNLLSGAAMAISAEAVVMGVKAGLDPAVMIDVINAGTGRNTATQDKFPKAILPRTFDFGFTTGLMYKDLKLCLEEAESLGLVLNTAMAVRQLWLDTLIHIGADEDFTTIVQQVERAAGVEVRGGG